MDTDDEEGRMDGWMIDPVEDGGSRMRDGERG